RDEGEPLHAEADHEMRIQEGGEPERERKRAEVNGEHVTDFVNILKNLLRDGEIADEGAEDQPGDECVAEGRAGHDDFLRRMPDAAERQRDTALARQRLALAKAEPDKRARAK